MTWVPHPWASSGPTSHDVPCPSSDAQMKTSPEPARGRARARKQKQPVGGHVKMLRAPPHVLMCDGPSCGDAGGSMSLVPRLTCRAPWQRWQNQSTFPDATFSNGCGEPSAAPVPTLLPPRWPRSRSTNLRLHRLCFVVSILASVSSYVRHGGRACTHRTGLGACVHGTEVVGSSGARA